MTDLAKFIEEIILRTVPSWTGRKGAKFVSTRIAEELTDLATLEQTFKRLGHWFEKDNNGGVAIKEAGEEKSVSGWQVGRMPPMKPAVNTSRITPPRLREILHRSRLLERLEKNKDKQFILILGQAAQGKSTLAASYVNTLEIPSAWLNLDYKDSDPVNLFYLLVHSLQQVLRDSDLSPVLGYPSITMGPREDIPLYREWAQAIFERISVPIQIVLDGLDRLSSDAPSFRFLQVMVEDLPQNIRLIMLSREMPPLKVQGLKMRQKIHVLTNEELAFTPDEIKTFFQEIQSMSLHWDQLRKIHQLTEGWIGGLILLSECLNRFQADLRDRYISETLPDHFQRKVFQYFGEEILSSQPSPIQEFLIKSSVFDMVEPGFMRDFLEMENTEKILHEHGRKNLFVQSIYDETKGWLFRYHQLFRGFLKAKFESEITKEERRSLFFKAGSLYEQRGELENSVKYYLEAKAYPQAACIIEKIGMDLLKMGRRGDLSQWLQAFPEDLIQENPWLLLYLSMTRRFTGVQENILILQKALTLFEKQGDLRGILLALAYLIEAVVRGYSSIPLGTLLDHGERLLQSSNSDLYPYERAVLWFQMGFGYIVRGGNPRKGFWACQNAYLISRDLEDLSLQVNALIHAIVALSFLGEFSLADEICEKLDKLMEICPYPELRSLQLINYSQLSICRGDLNKARELVRMARDETEKHGLIYLYPIALLYDLMLRLHLGEYTEVEEIGNRLLSRPSLIDSPFINGLALLYLGLSFYHKGKFQRAKELIGRSRQVLSSDKARSETHLHMVKIIMSLICYHLQENGSAEKELQESLNYFSDISSHLLMVDAHFAMALLQWKRAKTGVAATHLYAGFEIAKEKGYNHFWILSPRDLMRACILAVELEVQGAMDYAAHLLATRLGSLADPELKSFSKHLNSSLKEKALGSDHPDVGTVCQNLADLYKDLGKEEEAKRLEELARKIRSNQ